MPFRALHSHFRQRAALSTFGRACDRVRQAPTGALGLQRKKMRWRASAPDFCSVLTHPLTHARPLCLWVVRCTDSLNSADRPRPQSPASMSASGPSTAATQAGGTAAVSAAADSAAAVGFKRTLVPIADERRVQPRLGHDEHDAAAAPAPTPSSSSSSSASSAVQSTPSCPAVRLYRHALESILAFSNRKTLAAALSVSREWLAAVGSMRALALKVTSLRPPAEPIASAAIGRHMSELDVSSLWRISPDALDSLTRLMPRLRCLRCVNPLLPTGANSNLHFPAGLRELHLTATNANYFTPPARRTRPEEDDSNCAASLNVAIAAAGRLMQLESLFLSVCRRRIDLLTFGPLAALPLLRHLDVFVYGEADPEIDDTDLDDLTDAHVGELRALPRLHSLDVNPITTSLLRRLLAQPHELLWKQISRPRPLTDADAALLPRLPSLTTLGLNP